MEVPMWYLSLVFTPQIATWAGLISFFKILVVGREHAETQWFGWRCISYGNDQKSEDRGARISTREKRSSLKECIFHLSALFCRRVDVWAVACLSRCVWTLSDIHTPLHDPWTAHWPAFMHTHALKLCCARHKKCGTRSSSINMKAMTSTVQA